MKWRNDDGMKPDLMVDALLLAGARGGRNKIRFGRHALRLTLLGDFAYDFYPKIIRNPYDLFTKFLRRFFEEFLTGGRRLLGVACWLGRGGRPNLCRRVWLAGVAGLAF